MTDSPSVGKMSPSHGDIEQEEKWIANVTNYQAPRALLDQVVMDYLVREGFKEAATNFASEANVTPPPYDTSLMDQQTAIRGAVESGDVSQAMELVNDLDPEILDTNPRLYFHLQQQRLLEHIKEGRIDLALEFAQEELSACGEENQDVLHELERTMALLVFDKHNQSPFSEMLQPSQRMQVASQLNAAIVDRQNFVVPDRLTTLVKLVAWSQDMLERKGIRAPKLIDITTGDIGH